MVYSLDLTRVFCSVAGFQFANMPKIYLCKIKCRNYISYYFNFMNLYIYILNLNIYILHFLYCNNCLNFELALVLYCFKQSLNFLKLKKKKKKRKEKKFESPFVLI